MCDMAIYRGNFTHFCCTFGISSNIIIAIIIFKIRKIKAKTVATIS